MKVMIYRYNSIYEPEVINAFKTMDFEVVECTNEMKKKDYTPSLAVKEIGDFLQSHPVDFVFSVNFFPYLAEVCNIYRLRYLSWIVDSPVMELYTRAITKDYNRVFIFDRSLCEEITPFNPGRIFHLPLAANVNAKKELFANTTGSIRKKFSHEVAFVGSLYTEKCPYDRAKNIPEKTRGFFDGIMKAQEMVYGYYFIEKLLTDRHIEDFKASIEGFYSLPEESFLTDKRTLSQLYIGNKISSMERIDTFKLLSSKFNISIYTGSDTSDIPGIHNMGLAKSLTEMPVIFNQSKINLNITSKVIRTGLPLRIFDILSCEGFCISNYQEEIPELFSPEEDLVMYTSPDELVYLVEYYLDHDKERKEIARNGYEKLVANYTFEKQMEKMLYTAFLE